MQVVYKNENKGSSSREANLMDTIICTRGISWYLEEKYTGGSRSRTIRIWNSRGIFSKYKERVWWRRQRGSQSSVIKKVRAERKDNRRICSEV